MVSRVGGLPFVPLAFARFAPGLTSEHKFIPDAYLHTDSGSRLAMLQGLMDTDGSIQRLSGSMEFSTCSDALADGVEWLAVSLGMKARRERRHTKAQTGNGKPSWRITIRSVSLCPFRLRRKVERWRPLKETQNWLLHGVTEAGRGLATCIEVAHKSHTFVIDHGVVTHNTEGTGGYELTCHLTGLYPHWWEGRRFSRAIDGWMAGKSNETTRDILQFKLLGPVVYEGSRKRLAGTGLIPAKLLGDVTFKGGATNLVDTIQVKHVSGKWSTLGVKSYQQGRGSFEGTSKAVILLDEEPPMDIYGECVIRTATTNGIIMLTFTPLLGMSEVVLQFMPAEFRPDTGD